MRALPPLPASESFDAWPLALPTWDATDAACALPLPLPPSAPALPLASPPLALTAPLALELPPACPVDELTVASPWALVSEDCVNAKSILADGPTATVVPPMAGLLACALTSWLLL